MDIFSVLSLAGGLVLFLYGMGLMGDSLKKLAGGKLESILAKLTSNRVKGFLLGFGVTAIIQSSSATTVMLVGFVNSGIMKLGQTISVVMGANLGTTVTGWLLSTSGIDGAGSILLKLLNPEGFAPILAVIGLLMTMVCKSDKKKDVGYILMGFAILMFGMEMMGDSVGFLENNAAFRKMLITFGNNPIMGILVGTIFTAIIQSSSASVGVLQALTLNPAITMSCGSVFPIILGMNIGATMPPVLSSLSGNRDAKRVALSCVYIKILGVASVCSVFYAINAFHPFAFLDYRATAVNIAVMHTLFNVVSNILLLPFSSLIEKLAVMTLKSNEEEVEEKNTFALLDERFIRMPSFAVEKAKELVCDMAHLSSKSFKLATGLINEYSEQDFARVLKYENRADKYEDKISTYLVKIAENQISAKDSRIVTELLHCIGDIERISDHALNIAETAKEVYDKKISFSDKALQDLSIITSAVTEVIDIAIASLENDDIDVAKKVEPLEQVIDRLKRKIKNGHISRLRQGDCTMELGFILSDLLTNFERIADHCSNIAVCFIEMSHDSFETHEYLNQLKSGDVSEFKDMYEMYKAKYYIE